MQTLKEIKESLYEDISNRYLDFLWDEEKYILENLQSEENWTKFNWTKTEAVNIVFQALDGYQMNWNENTIWVAWYVRWYEVALQELMNHFKAINISWEINNIEYTSKIFTSNKLEEMLNNLLTN